MPEKVGHGAAHIEKHETQLGVFTGQNSEDGFLANGHQDNVSLFAFNIDLLQGAAPQF